MKPRKITIDGIEVVLVGCRSCPCIGRDGEMGDTWCNHPILESKNIQPWSYDNPTDAKIFESFPNFCPLKEV